MQQNRFFRRLAFAAGLSASAFAKTYDSIVVGAGPSGIIVAERLAEHGDQVLLIERGPASTYKSGGTRVMPWNDTATVFDIPSYAYSLFGASDMSEFCTDTAGMAGCLLGGGTSVNAEVFIHPQPVDFDDKWPSGWKWNDVAASAEKLYERNPGTDLPSSDGQRYDQAVFDVLSGLLGNNSWTETDPSADPSAKYQVYSHPVWSVKNGMRAGPAATYLPLVQNYSNFELMLETKVVRVVRSGSSITGVEIESSNGTSRETISLNNNGKVILAAGTLSTPRILFNSGIGPTAQIEIVQSNATNNVTLPPQNEWINLPVGENVKDHPIVTLNLETTQTSFTAYNFTALGTSDANVTDTSMYNERTAGIIAQGGQRLIFWTNLNGTDGQTRYFQGTVGPSADNSFSVKVYLTHGLTSNGTLVITPSGSTNLSVVPYFTTEADRAAAISFIDTFREYVGNQSDIVVASSQANMSTAEIIESYTGGDHFVGTARMGESVDDGVSVVDTDTKVFGTENLFVVDASIHPDLPTGNTQAIVMVVAEKAAEKIISSDTSSVSASVSASASASVSLNL